MHQDNSGPVSINSILSSSSNSFSSTSDLVTGIIKVQQKLRSELGPPLSEHLNVANLNNHTLTLFTESPAWASRLRFNIKKILEIAKNNCGLDQLKSVRIKIILLDRESKSAKQTVSLSPKTAKLISQTAASINDSKLHDSLLKLADHQK